MVAGTALYVTLYLHPHPHGWVRAASLSACLALLGASLMVFELGKGSSLERFGRGFLVVYALFFAGLLIYNLILPDIFR